MAYNLFIAYDLMKPGQNYEGVRDRIKSLGLSYQFQLSLFYVNTSYTPQDAYAYVMAAMDTNDRLAVINAASDLGAVVTTWDKPSIDAINAIWITP